MVPEPHEEHENKYDDASGGASHKYILSYCFAAGRASGAEAAQKHGIKYDEAGGGTSRKCMLS